MKLKVFTDWWSRWNPWESWIWIYITDKNWLEVEKIYKYTWIKTNNEAEYLWAYFWIQKAIELWCNEIELYMDSKLVIEQLSWEWKIKKYELKILNSDIIKLITNNNIKIGFYWISREKNKEADMLANIAIDKKIY